MGIPYSKQINGAFTQVTPLVAAGFEVLQTTKNISILLASIQVLTCVFLGLILLALLGIICTLSPHLETETQTLVIPVVRWLASWLLVYGTAVGWTLRVAVVATTAGLGVFFWQGSLAGNSVPGTPATGEVEGEGPG
ncbi:hypothetical protein M406DRAFT_283893 [Cryphonectria parasitica EP155]|uniref:Uncharacterized protein n=1 Tax=Cryphonectria parasitica (strain ATCC 38755 / EP155) TaxID=660469 RepID=A0A9P4YAK8_CRYP1|nr:uncharacterized protein M406DRAFT_283893 [Cryphonectria parasitica EP155]KAF3769496.1 hypothetical protein M406DRAFT_283893 [Cryphonectria parasitica EP155]